jgi:hypothetical protein
MKANNQVIIALFTLSAVFGNLACSKSNSKTPEQLLTSSPWRISMDRGVIGNNIVFYQRGGSQNTENLDNESISFASGGTGVYTDNGGTQYDFTWSFTNADKTTLVWNVTFGTPVIITWDILTLTSSTLEYDEYYTEGTNNETAFLTRIH